MWSKLKNNFIENIRKGIPVIYTFFILLLLLRFYEYFSFIKTSTESGIKLGYLFGGIFIDFIFANGITLFLIFIQSCFLYRKVKNTYIIEGLLLIILLINGALSQVYLESLEPLDKIFYTFSYDEIVIIAGLKKINIFLIIVSFSVGILYYYILFFFRKKKIEQLNILFLFCVIGVFLIFKLNYHSDKHVAVKIVNNKFVYFMNSTIDMMFEDEEELRTNLKIDPKFLGGKIIDSKYPAIHPLSLDKKFANLFNVNTKKEPNIVIIIVEALGTNYVGKYAHEMGDLMPFLDSLTKKSLYFPNTFSTAERTFNVLPAVLSSVPNAPIHERFMEMEFPQHWSLMSLLSRQYYSRFYCGVYLEFHRMDRFMKYHETDYLVHSWEKKFKEKLPKKYLWGYSDDQLFEKSLMDLNGKHSKIKKSRMDVLLTVSTHHPYQIPNQEYYTKQIKKEFEKKKRIETDEYIKHSSTYRFTDNCIRNYFKKISKNKDYDNTIFIITGDHGSQLKSKNELCRAAVPIIITSKLLKKPQTYLGACSHLDIAPSLLSLLHYNYGVSIPQNVPFMGKGLNLQKEYKLDVYQPISSFNLNYDFLVYGNHFLYHDQLFKIEKNLELKPLSNDKYIKKLKTKLNVYNNFTSNLIYNDVLIPTSYFQQYWYKGTYKLLTRRIFKEINASTEYINIGEKIPFKKVKVSKGIKVVATFKAYLNKYSDYEKICPFTASLETKAGSFFWQQASSRINQRFIKKGWIKLKYVFEVPKAKMKNRKNFYFNYYILNSSKKNYHIKDLELNFFVK